VTDCSPQSLYATETCSNTIHNLTVCAIGVWFLKQLHAHLSRQVSSYSGLQHAFPSHRLRLKCDGTRAETRFRFSAKRTSPFKSAGKSVQSTTGSRGVRVSSSNAGYTMFQDSVKSNGYPLHSPVPPSLPLPCDIVCHHISTGLYFLPLWKSTYTAVEEGVGRTDYFHPPFNLKSPIHMRVTYCIVLDAT
jgi:hypothetical protein